MSNNHSRSPYRYRGSLDREGGWGADNPPSRETGKANTEEGVIQYGKMRRVDRDTDREKEMAGQYGGLMVSCGSNPREDNSLNEEN